MKTLLSKIEEKLKNFVIVSFQITVDNNHYDIYYDIFQSYYLSALLECLYICSICILSYLLVEHGQVSNKTVFGSRRLLGRSAYYRAAPILIWLWNGVTLIWDPELTRGNSVRLRRLSIVSKNQSNLRKCCI